MAQCPDCPVFLRGFRIPGAAAAAAGSAPTILARTDANFIEAVLDQVGASAGAAGARSVPVGTPSLGSSIARVPEDENYLKLYPPVQRTFNLALVEAGCDVFGEPRLDPARIESAGLVVRRVYRPNRPVAGAGSAKSRRAIAGRSQSVTAAVSSGVVPVESGPMTSLGLMASGSTGTPRARAKATASDLRGFLEEAVGTVTVRGQVADSAAPGAFVGTPGSPRYEAWSQVGSQLQGWLPLQDDELKDDPDPARRRLLLQSGNRFIDELLADTGLQPRAEAITPLFVAPPEVCAAAGKTVLYGLIPVSGSETSDTPEALPSFPAASVEAHLSKYLKAGKPSLPQAGKALDASAADQPDELMAGFILLLRQLAIEFDAFGKSTTSTALLSALNQVKLSFTFFSATQVQALPGNAFRDLLLANLPAARQVLFPGFPFDFEAPFGITVPAPAGDFLRVAVPILVERLAEDPDDGRSLSLIMPDEWPEVTDAQAAAIESAITGAMQARVAGLASKSGRFDEVDRLYVVSAFVRLRPGDGSDSATGGCPPSIIWTDPSEPFRIAAWYESSGATPAQVRLPDVSDRDFLKKIKPNVAFVMPEGLFNMLNRSDPKDLAQGSADTGGDTIGLQWICSFSIPIITICAFIVLYIFLTLFDLIFRWMMFVKICIPFPKKG